MYLTLTNTGPEPEALSVPGGDEVDVLHTNAAFDFNDDEVGVLVVGDRPDLRDQFKRAAQVISAAAKQLLTLIAGRKQHALDAGRPELVSVHIANHGPNAVRVILGDGTKDTEIAAGASMACSAPGYLELRELGTLDESQLDGGTQPAVA